MNFAVLEVNFEEMSPISWVYGPRTWWWAAKLEFPKGGVSPSSGHNLGQTYWNEMVFGGGGPTGFKEQLYKYRVLIPCFDGFQAKITGFR